MRSFVNIFPDPVRKFIFFPISNLTEKSPSEILWLEINPIGRGKNTVFTKKISEQLLHSSDEFCILFHLAFDYNISHKHPPLLNPTSYFTCCVLFSALKGTTRQPWWQLALQRSPAQRRLSDNLNDWITRFLTPFWRCLVNGKQMLCKEWSSRTGWTFPVTACSKKVYLSHIHLAGIFQHSPKHVGHSSAPHDQQYATPVCWN